MNREQAITIIRTHYPNAVIRKVWMPKRGASWFKVISEPLSWNGGIGGSFSHVELSKPSPTSRLALVNAALRISGVIQ